MSLKTVTVPENEARVIGLTSCDAQSSLGSRMKDLEKDVEKAYLDTSQVIIARLDGRSFSKFTKTMNKPFDDNFAACMKETAKQLITAFNPDVAYVQSDEITLIWMPKNIPDTNTTMFSGRIQKLCSVLSGAASVAFFKTLLTYLPDFTDGIPHLDCRVWNTNEKDAYASLVWRQRDCIKNSISMAAHVLYPTSGLHKKSGEQKIKMLLSKGVNWYDYDPHYKYGTFFRKREELVPLTPEQLAKIPEKYRPTGPVPRSVIKEFQPGPLALKSGSLELVL